MRIALSGLEPGETVTLDAYATDFRARTWHSSARFRADRAGRVDVARAAPLSGTYRGADPGGLLWSMRPPKGTRNASFAAGEKSTLRIEASAQGRRPASRTVKRPPYPPGAVTVTPFDAEVDGITADLFTPRDTRFATAVLVFGGSEGGFGGEDIAAALAARGYTAMSLAYFHAPGLHRARLRRVPLEYFAQALARLRAQRGVRRVATLSISRGTEAALLVAGLYPGLVDGTIAIVPSSAVNIGADFRGTAWTYRGKPVPHGNIAQWGNPTLTPKRARIPVEQADGPILAAGGGDDIIWPSDEYVAQIRRRLAARSHVRGHVTVVYKGAGHSLGMTLPNIPGFLEWMGGSAAADARARADLWRRILRFLREL